ncbi:hypothetical protein D3C76_787480 [compost metagenome]
MVLPELRWRPGLFATARRRRGKGLQRLPAHRHEQQPFGVRAQHGDHRHHPPRRSRQRRAHHRFRPALSPVRPPFPPGAAVPADRAAAGAAPGDPARPSDPRLRQALPCRRRLQPYPLPGRCRAHPPDHRRAAVLHPARDALRAQAPDQHGDRRRRAAGRRAGRSGQGLPQAHRYPLARMGAFPGDSLRVAGRGDPRRHHPQAVQLRGNRRHHRRGDHFHPGGTRHPAQLGLPLLLAARRLLRDPRAQSPGCDQDHGALRRLHRHGSHRRRRPAAAVWHRPRPGPHGTHRARPRRLPRPRAGAGRQPGGGTGPARRLRFRGAGGAAELRRPAPPHAERRGHAAPARIAGRAGRPHRLRAGSRASPGGSATARRPKPGAAKRGACGSKSCATPGASAASASPAASAWTTWTPASC